MPRGSKAINGLALTALLTGAGLLARKATAEAWAMAADKPPPREEDNFEVDMKEAVAWALVSGAVVGLARLLVRRGIGYRGSPLDPGTKEAISHAQTRAKQAVGLEERPH